MAYFRGEYYIYQDVDGTMRFYTPDLSGSLPMNILDELVVMRYAEIKKEREIKEFEKKTIKKLSGNFGADALCEKYKVPTTKKIIKKLEKKIHGKTNKS